MDDILLYSLVAQLAQSPSDFVISDRRAVASSRTASCCARTIPRSRRSSTTRCSTLYKSGEINGDLRQVVPEADPAEGHQPQRADERRS